MVATLVLGKKHSHLAGVWQGEAVAPPLPAEVAPASVSKASWSGDQDVSQQEEILKKSQDMLEGPRLLAGLGNAWRSHWMSCRRWLRTVKTGCIC